MVNGDDGQLYTIEGFAAALIMIITAYLVVNATSVYTAGDTHITDMQLEALGTDALKMMDTPVSSDVPSPLQGIIENTPIIDENATFKSIFLGYTNLTGAGPIHDIQFVANYTCRNNDDNKTKFYPLASSRSLTGGEHSVKATRWVIVNKDVCGNNFSPDKDRAVIVEVLLWRD
jgi:hypothetical protein